MDYNSLKLTELKELINREHFFNIMGKTLNKAKKAELVKYLNENQNTVKNIENVPKTQMEVSKEIVSYDPCPRKPLRIDNFKPNDHVLNQIRSELNESKSLDRMTHGHDNKHNKKTGEAAVSAQIEIVEIHDKKTGGAAVSAHGLSPELKEILDDNDPEDDRDDSDLSQEEEYNHDAKYEEKVAMYTRAFPDLKKVANGEYKSSKEKYYYVQDHMNKTQSQKNVMKWILTLANITERSEYINRYIKIKGLSRNIGKRQTELNDLITELKIKHYETVGHYLDQGPETRLAITLGEIFHETFENNYSH